MITVQEACKIFENSTSYYYIADIVDGGNWYYIGGCNENGDIEDGHYYLFILKTNGKIVPFNFIENLDKIMKGKVIEIPKEFIKYEWQLQSD